MVSGPALFLLVLQNAEWRSLSFPGPDQHQRNRNGAGTGGHGSRGWQGSCREPATPKREPGTWRYSYPGGIVNPGTDCCPGSGSHACPCTCHCGIPTMITTKGCRFRRQVQGLPCGLQLASLDPEALYSARRSPVPLYLPMCDCPRHQPSCRSGARSITT